MWIFLGFLSDALLMIFINIKCQRDFIMWKVRISTLILPWHTKDREGIRVQKYREKLCGVFNSNRSQFKSRLLHERKSPHFKTRFVEIVKTTKIWASKNKLQRVHRWMCCTYYMCQSPNKFISVWQKNVIDSVHTHLKIYFFMNMSTA